MLAVIKFGRVRLLDNPRLVNQLINLERKTGRGTGKDVIDHPRGEHDDLANACAGVLTCTAARTPLLIDPDVLARSARPDLDRYRRGHWDNGYFVSHWFG